MNKLISKVRRTPLKISLLVAVIAAAVIVPASLFAWGPSRQTFTTAKPADYITFNSITDNPAQGDERNFMQVKESTASNSTYSDSISLAPGKEYTVFMYYHNNAAANLKLVAEGTYAKAQIPAVVANGAKGVKAVGYIVSTNANPMQVWDDIAFSNNSGGDIALRFVPSSAHIYNQGAINGAILSDSIVTNGAILGYNSLDGKVPGCNQYAGYVTFKLIAEQPNFLVEKQVRVAGSTSWSKSVEAKIGDTVEYQVQYKNTGTTTQNNVVLKDTMPSSIVYTAGSSVLKNNTYPAGTKVSDNIVTAGGINIGNYSSGSNAYMKLGAKVTDKGLVCGKNTLTNTVTAQTNNGSKSDSANVVVTKVCPPNTPVNPNTPSHLPETGPADMLMSAAGIGTVSAAASYLIASRRRRQ